MLKTMSANWRSVRCFPVPSEFLVHVWQRSVRHGKRSGAPVLFSRPLRHYLHDYRQKPILTPRAQRPPPRKRPAPTSRQPSLEHSSIKRNGFLGRLSEIARRLKTFITAYVVVTLLLYAYTFCQWAWYREIVPITERSRFGGVPKANRSLAVVLKRLDVAVEQLDVAELTEEQKAKRKEACLDEDNPVVTRIHTIFERLVVAAGLEKRRWRITVVKQDGMRIVNSQGHKVRATFCNCAD